MLLKEYDGKNILTQYGVLTPRGFLARSAEEVAEKINMIHTPKVYVKAQVPFGRKMRQGATINCSKSTAAEAARELLGKTFGHFTVSEVLIEEQVPAAEEYFVALTYDPLDKSYLAMYATQGGIDFDEFAAAHPEQIRRIRFQEYDATAVHAQIPEEGLKDEGVLLGKKLHNIMLDTDALLIEINPLIITTDGDMVAADVKMVIDNNALFRQTRLEEKRIDETPWELLASKTGIHYVESEGDTLIVGNGAGIIMLLADLLAEAKLSCAGYLDMSGAPDPEEIKAALMVLHFKKPKQAIITIFGGVTSCVSIAEEIVAFHARHPHHTLITRFAGQDAVPAQEMMRAANITTLPTMEACIAHITGATSGTHKKGGHR